LGYFDLALRLTGNLLFIPVKMAHSKDPKENLFPFLPTQSFSILILFFTQMTASSTLLHE